jgi:heme/copper-type cytochrome/quinol oxidase subunit 1
MTNNDAHVGAARHEEGAGSPFVRALGDWLTSSDHKKIGRLFIGCSLLFALATGVIGALLNVERMSPSSMSILHGDAVLQIFSAYEFGLVLGVLAPLFAGIAIAVVPMQVGSRAVAFPRLAQFSFWAWFFGTALVVVSLVSNGGPGGGNTDMVDLYLLGLGLACAGIIGASLSVASTVLTSRAPGMDLDFVPAFSWSALVGSIATMLSLPVAIGTIVYVYVDHTHSKVAFGDNKQVSSFIGWTFSQPMTFVLVIAALGVLAEVAPVTAKVRQPMRPVVLTGLGLVSTAVLGTVTQTAHVLDWSGSSGDKVKSAIPFLLFNGLPLLGILVVIAASMLSLKVGRPRVSGAFAASALGALMVLVGAAGNLIAHVKSAGLVGTVFIEGVTLYVVYGAVLCGVGAIAHWAPKLWGRTLDDSKVLGLAALGLIGTIASSFTMYIAGFADQPAAEVYKFNYDGPIALWNSVSAIGHLLVVVSVLGLVGLLVAAVRSGSTASDDPWDGHTLEWAIPSPAPTNNFASLATVGSPEPVLDAKPAPSEVPA